jgi:hypothetical protein
LPNFGAQQFASTSRSPNKSCDNKSMSTTIEPALIPPEIMAELEEAARRAADGIRDPEAMRQACERMDRMREEIFRKHGILDIGVPAIRELRDSE